MEEENKIIVIAPENCKGYLTPSKEYVAKNFYDNGTNACFDVLDDKKTIIFCIEKDCSHLNGSDWIIKPQTL
jgi:hypothetical protein